MQRAQPTLRDPLGRQRQADGQSAGRFLLAAKPLQPSGYKTMIWCFFTQVDAEGGRGATNGPKDRQGHSLGDSGGNSLYPRDRRRDRRGCRGTRGLARDPDPRQPQGGQIHVSLDLRRVSHARGRRVARQDRTRPRQGRVAGGEADQGDLERRRHGDEQEGGSEVRDPDDGLQGRSHGHGDRDIAAFVYASTHAAPW